MIVHSRLGITLTLVCTMNAAHAEEKKWEPNYDESKIPAYTLPDPLVMDDGTTVEDPQQWVKRRNELIALFEQHVYGKAPRKPDDLRFKQFDHTPDALDGKAVRKQIRIDFAKGADAPGMDLLMYLPSKTTKPVPTFLLLNFQGNHAVNPDPGIRLSTSWVRDGYPGVENNHSTEASRGAASRRFPIDMILERGYGLATAYYGDIDPDYDDGFNNGVHAQFDTDPRPDNAWASIAAWAWGLRRAMDYLETDNDVDPKHVFVMGHSRLGKTALWAGALDERFAMVISNNSGCGGAALCRRAIGETVGKINQLFPHWFCKNFTRYNERENDLPVDQHMLIALAAPRPIYVASAEKDRWADPKGEFLSCLHADPVYRLLGTTGMPAKRWPALDEPVHGRIGYHYRTGGHDVTDYDWQQYIDFAEKHFQGK